VVEVTGEAFCEPLFKTQTTEYLLFNHQNI
jgi:hypothetical protein